MSSAHVGATTLMFPIFFPYFPRPFFPRTFFPVLFLYFSPYLFSLCEYGCCCCCCCHTHRGKISTGQNIKKVREKIGGGGGGKYGRGGGGGYTGKNIREKSMGKKVRVEKVREKVRGKCTGGKVRGKKHVGKSTGGSHVTCGQGLFRSSMRTVSLPVAHHCSPANDN